MLSFEHAHDPSITIVALSGPVDAKFSLALEVILASEKLRNVHHLILNFADVHSLDLSGLGELFMWYHNLRLQGIQLSISKPSPKIRDTWETVHLTELIPIYSPTSEEKE